MMLQKTIYIKNMVCPRCISSVENLLWNLGYEVLDVKLGEANLRGEINLHKIKEELEKKGFELLQDENQQLAEKIKTEIISIIHHEEINENYNLSAILSDRIRVDYHYLSQVFSEIEGINIERFYILQRIEKVKELLQYNQQTIKEIAYSLGFSSVAHLSAQFKKETGFTPKEYRAKGSPSRKSINSIL